MDEEQWACPKCGFINEYYAAYCVSCSEIRHVAPTETPADAQTTGDDLSWDSRPASTPVDLRPAIPVAPRPAIPVAPRPATPVEPPLSSDKRAPWPRSLGKIRGVVFFVILIGVIIPLVSNILEDASTPATTEYWEWTYPTDDEYVSLADIDPARSALLGDYQVKWDAWLAEGQGEIPTAEYLLVDELLTFQDMIAGVDTPTDPHKRDLYWTWTMSLSLLVLAENSLAREPTQENLDARTQAWADEATAYQAFYELTNSL